MHGTRLSRPFLRFVSFGEFVELIYNQERVHSAHGTDSCGKGAL